ncbi:MAG: DUF533 domain-containing protein [Chthoniobacterales bacterium]|nr:DUF533 domain-containing protein [Chthoniobacterales bacterium]
MDRHPRHATESRASRPDIVNPSPDQAQRQGMLGICLMAAFADGNHGDEERDQMQRMAALLGGDDKENSAILQDVLFKRVTLDTLCAPLAGQPAAAQAYEMGAVVCGVDKNLAPEERTFLAELREKLGLAGDAILVTEEIMNPAPAALAKENTLTDQTSPADTERMILNYAILNGALELLPQSLATMAVIPMQMKMVYRIGRAHGVELDAARIKELAAAAGLGLTSQVLEGYARRLLKGLLGKKSMAGKVTGQAASSAFAFASTYALGHVAQAYYGSGRKMTKEQMKTLFDSVSDRARGLYETYLPQIQDKAKGLDLPGVLAAIKSPTSPANV